MRTAVIGLGVMGRTHANAMKKIEGAELVCVVDVDPAKREKAVSDLGVPAYETLEAALAVETLDMVNIALPTYLHSAYAVKAAEAGLHVLCEKPMAMTPDECKAMIEASRKAGKELMIAQVLRFWPEYIKLKEIIDAGTYGKLLAIHCTRLSGPPLWSWDNWLMDAPRSGGALLDLHVHDIDWINCLCGRPKSVFASGLKIDRFGGWAHVLANYNYGNVMATAEGGWAYQGAFGFQMAFRATLEGAVITYSLSDSPTMKVATPDSKEWQPVDLGAKMAEEDSGGNISSTDGYFNECKYFVETVNAGKSPTDVVTPEQAMHNIEIANAEERSCETGTLVALP
jgi:predicted dehydrogenase